MDAGSRAAAAYSMPNGGGFILQATAGIYRGEIGGPLQSESSLSTNPIGGTGCCLTCKALCALSAEGRLTTGFQLFQVMVGRASHDICPVCRGLSHWTTVV